MKINVKRYSASNESTLGLLYIDGKFACYTLEDEYRNVKLKGETRIKEGEYEIKFRKEGGHHAEYGKKFPQIHKGMLELQNVPEFQYILIHIGNTDKDTDGCILVGDAVNNNKLVKGNITQSTIAYQRIYTPIAKALEAGQKVTIKIENLEGL